MINHLVSFSIQHRKFVLLLSLLFSLAFGYLAKDIRMDNSNDQFWIEGEPSLEAYQKFHEIFGSEEFFLIFIEGDHLTSNNSLAALDELYGKVTALEIEKTKPFAQIISPLHTPMPSNTVGVMEFLPLIDQDPGDSQRSTYIHEKLSNHPLFYPLLYGKSGKAMGIFATIKKEQTDEYRGKISDSLHGLMENESWPFTMRLVGPPELKKVIDRTTVNETPLFGGGALLVSIFVLAFLYRRFSAVFATVFVILTSLIFTMGCMGVFYGRASMVLVILPLVLVITGLGTCVHILNAYRHELETDPPQRGSTLFNPTPLLAAFTHTGSACFFTSLTTCVGFLSLMVVPIAPIRTLGIFTALGVMAIFVAATTLLPAIMAMDKKGIRIAGHKPPATHFILKPIAHVSTTHPKMVTILCLLVALGLSLGIKNLRIESNFGQAFAERHPHRIAIEAVDKHMAGTATFEMIFDTGVSGGALDPQFLKRLDQFESWILENKRNFIRHITSPGDLFQLINEGLGSSALRYPSSEEEAAQLMLLYEMSEGPENKMFDPDRRRAHLTLFSKNLPTDRVQAEESIIFAQAERIMGDPKLSITLTGVMPMFARLTNYIVASQLQTFGVAGLVIILFMIWVLRSFRLGIATMVPNLLPIIATYGFMGWMSYPLDWLSAIIPGVALGFAVDGTIHFGLTFKALREAGKSAQEAAEAVILRVGKAIVVTSLTLSAGFCIFGFSILINLAHLGLMLAFCFVLALIADILMTPALLVWLEGGSPSSRE